MKDFDHENGFRVSPSGRENGVYIGKPPEAGATLTQAQAVNLACWLLVTCKVTQAELVTALALIEDT